MANGVIRPSSGGFLRPFGLGMFIRAYLLGQDTYGAHVADPKLGAPTDDIRAAYKNAILKAHAEDLVALALERGIELPLDEALRRIPHRLTSIRSHSFYRYFHHLKLLGWVEFTGQEEDSLMGGSPGAKVVKTTRGATSVEVPMPRRFYRLTVKGKRASVVEWSDPLQALYHYPKEQRSSKKAERKVYKPGSLPRLPSTRKK